MNENTINIINLALGILIIFILLFKSLLTRFKLPSIIGFFIIGFLLSYIFSKPGLTIPIEKEFIQTLGNIGLICLLFRVGMDSDINKLIQKIPQASYLLLLNISFCAILGFLTAYYLLKFSFISSLFAGIALTPTSEAIAVNIWQEKNILNTSSGSLLVDLTEMDDFTGILSLALLLALVPAFKSGQISALVLSESVGVTLLKFGLFILAFYLLFRYTDKPMVNLFHKYDKGTDPIIFLLGFGIIIAAIAGILGLSSAIGAFLAGLVFSRVPDKSRIFSAFTPFYNFFVPFFFINIGAKTDLTLLLTGIDMGILLFIAAFLGKFVSIAGLTIKKAGMHNAVILGLSMVPRAEMTLVIMQKGLQAGIASVGLFSAIVFVSIVTCLITPIALRFLLNRWQIT